MFLENAAIIYFDKSVIVMAFYTGYFRFIGTSTWKLQADISLVGTCGRHQATPPFIPRG